MDALLVTAAIVAVVLAGRWIARRLHQPAMVVEIALCLALGWLVLPRLGWGAGSFGHEPLSRLGHLGLALFLVGAAHQMREGFDRRLLRPIGCIAVGSAVLPMAGGAVLALWVLQSGNPLLRGQAPAPAFVMMLAIALAVTAVPVLAGILQDRGIERTEDGRLSLMSASAIDVVTWILFAVAIGLTRDDDGSFTGVAVLAGGIAAALAARPLLSAERSLAWADRHPRVLVVLVAVAAIVSAELTRSLGLTDVFGAVLVGLALPDRWAFAARLLGSAARVLLPVLFVITGTGVAAGPAGIFSWEAIVLATVLAIGTKLAGSYLGARAGGRSVDSGLRIAVLMNTRGLTEIVILQAGFIAGLLSPALYLALLVMALITTGLSGPLLQLAERRERTVVDQNIRLAER
ncbi:cation:proton antiporter [Nonomuraea sp. NPDC002799]